MGTLINSPVTIGNNNNVSVDSKLDSIQWEAIKNDCFSAMQKLPMGSAERNAAEEVFADAVRKDRGKLKNTIVKYAKELSSEVFTGAASILLVDFIKNMLL